MFRVLVKRCNVLVYVSFVLLPTTKNETYLNSSIDKKLRPTNPFKESAMAVVATVLFPKSAGDACFINLLMVNMIAGAAER